MDEKRLSLKKTTGVLEASAFAFVKELGYFSYELSSLDRVWQVLFPDQRGQWNRLHVIKYKDTFYITHAGSIDGCLEIEPKKGVRVKDYMKASSSYSSENYCQPGALWELLITSARKWLKIVAKDWIRANKRVQTEYPLNYRYGVVPNALIRSSLPDVYRIDKELGKAGTRKLVRLVEDGYFLKTENTEVPTITAADYFQYCRIAYIAGKRKDEKVDESLTGREMYSKYADGRHEGLLDIDPTSKREFAKWIDGTHPKRSRGGHPWEIKRGGNETHIDLSVSRPSLFQRDGFKVELRGASLGRIVEAMRMFLAIHEAKFPVTIANPEGVRLRLLAQDNIGIVPSYAYPDRTNKHFEKDEDVFDIMYYDDFGRFKRRITPFITWKPLPILKPRDA